MSIVLWTFAASFLWFLLGCVVLCAIDDERQSLFEWARSCPLPGGYTITVMCWPVVLWMWKRRQWTSGSMSGRKAKA